jgi:DNA replication protein DnaC
VCKAHLVVGLGLGIKAIEHGYRVVFTTVAAMIATLTQALGEGRLEENLKLSTATAAGRHGEIDYARKPLPL